MKRVIGRILTWAVDGPGSRFQGRPAVGVAVILMMLPICLNVVGMRVFGYRQGSETYHAVTTLTVSFWILPALYLLGILIFGLYRLIQEIGRAFGSKGEAKRGSDDA